MTDNLALWNALGRTDPSQTKKFKRGGGFSGTAIKPVYTEQKMTETFGPVGIGWGFSEPKFQIVPGDNKEMMVFCWLTLWFVQDGNKSSDIPGVGGDKIVTHIKASEQYNRPERWENDDEAFKKAFTDALGNAMKHLGMSADVHMGLFDDSKYIREVEAEIRQEKQPAPTSSVNSPTGVDAAEISRLIRVGDEAASRGRDALNAFGLGRSRAELAAFGRKRIADWETRADEIDRMTVNDPALQEAVS